MFEVDERFIVLIRMDGEFYALDDACTHDGGPLGEGFLDGYRVVAAPPRHRFNVRTGVALTMPAVQATSAARSESGGRGRVCENRRKPGNKGEGGGWTGEGEG